MRSTCAALSEDLDKLINLFTRIVVMFDRRSMGCGRTGELTLGQIGQWMAGLDSASAETAKP